METTPTALPARDERVPTRLLVHYRVAGVEDLVERFSANLSYSGMFLVSRELPAVGSEIAFELREEGGAIALSGRGVVRWTRPDTGSDAQPPGIGLLFTSLDDENRRRVHLLVDRAIAARAAGIDPVPLRTAELEASTSPAVTEAVPWRIPDEPSPATPTKTVPAEAEKLPWWRRPL